MGSEKNLWLSWASIDENDCLNIPGSTKITIDFIKKYNPESIELTHRREKSEVGNHAQRAMLNKRILDRELGKECPNYSYKLIKKHGFSVSIIKKN